MKKKTFPPDQLDQKFILSLRDQLQADPETEVSMIVTTKQGNQIVVPANVTYYLIFDLARKLENDQRKEEALRLREKKQQVSSEDFAAMVLNWPKPTEPEAAPRLTTCLNPGNCPVNQSHHLCQTCVKRYAMEWGGFYVKPTNFKLDLSDPEAKQLWKEYRKEYGRARLMQVLAFFNMRRIHFKNMILVEKYCDYWKEDSLKAMEQNTPITELERYYDNGDLDFCGYPPPYMAYGIWGNFFDEKYGSPSV